MAMKSCRECGQKVSSEAKVCPGCGVKKPYQSPVHGLIFIGIVVIAVLRGVVVKEAVQVIHIILMMLPTVVRPQVSPSFHRMLRA